MEQRKQKKKKTKNFSYSKWIFVWSWTENQRDGREGGHLDERTLEGRVKEKACKENWRKYIKCVSTAAAAILSHVIE
jgi:transposase